MKKQCQMCKLMKPIEKFHFSKNTKDGRFSYCGPCKIEANKRSNKKLLTENREKFLDQRKKWHLKAAFGMKLSDYKNLMKKQGNVCAICKNFDEDRMLAVDHCHKSKKIRGLLCQRCNRGIGMFFDNPQTLRLAAEYIEK